MAGFLTIEREAILARTIREWASTPCEPYPCAASVWAYACEVSGVDAPALPRHETREAVATLLRKEGGLEAYARRQMRLLSWLEGAPPARGDVGLVELPEMGLTCAISLGSKWLAKGPRRVLITAAPHIASWSPPSCLKPSPPPLLPQLD